MQSIEKPTLGVCYYPEHWPRDVWEKDAVDMAALGIEYVRIGEFAWSRLEAKRGAYDFGWLIDAMNVLNAAGLKVVMGTPTATPPKWLIDEMPDMLALDEEGRVRGFGSRRHYCFSHEGYRAECIRITKALCDAVKDHPALAAWQTDNEYGCHSTTVSYSNAAKFAFRNWLSQKYQSPDALNKAWGNVFWSMEYGSFDEVELPNLTATEPNPSHVLDFRRFASDQVVFFNKAQVNIIRQATPDLPIIHNFMGWFLEFDHHDVSNDLDIASWDSYPLGFLERSAPSDEHRNKYLRAGDPDFQALHHDLYRGMCTKTGKGRWWVMEQQPGPVNWADWNPAPRDGMVRLWSWEAFAHGAEVVSYFRWRQAPFAQEQMHAGLNRPNYELDKGGEEARQVAEELTAVNFQTETDKAPIAFVWDYPSYWMAETQPQGKDYDLFELAMMFYRTARQFGQSVDIVKQGADLSDYKMVLLPASLMLTETGMEALRNTSAQIVCAARTGQKTPDLQIPSDLPPGPLQELIPIKVERVESLRPGITVPIRGESNFSRWREFTRGDAHVELSTADGVPAVWSHENIFYLAGWPSEELLRTVFKSAARRGGVPLQALPEGVRRRRHNRCDFYFNYSDETVSLEKIVGEDADYALGNADLLPSGVSIVRLREGRA